MKKLFNLLLSMLLVLSCLNISTSTVKADNTTKGNKLTLKATLSESCQEYVELAGKELYSVAGAEYTVKDEDNNEVGVFVIGEDGVGTVKGTTDTAMYLPDGKYGITLTKQPTNKAVIGDTDERSTKYVTLTSNTPKPTTITVNTITALYGKNSSGKYFSNNQYKLWTTTYGTGVFECGIAEVDSPCQIESYGSHTLNVSDAKVLDRTSTTDGGYSAELIYKIMYYGRSGPAQWSGFANYSKPFMSRDGSTQYTGGHSGTEALAAFVTHVALSRAWGRDKGKWSLQSDIAGFNAFWNYVNSAENAPDDFVVYVWEHSKVHSKEQDMFFGYTLAPTDYDSQEVTMELQTDYDPVTIILTKAGTSSERIANAEFTIKYYNSVLTDVASGDETSPVRTWVFRTNEKGIFRYNSTFLVSGDELFFSETKQMPVLIAGTYIVSETKVPEGYVKADDFMIRVNTDIGNSISYYAADGVTPITRNIENGYELTEYKEGYLNLKKVSANELSTVTVKGAVYNVYTDENCTTQAVINNSNDYAVLTVGEDGTSNSVALKAGTYYVKEVETPKGYMLNATVYKVDLTEKETVTIEAEDEPILYKAAKVDVNGEYVQGAVIELYEGNTLLTSFTTGNEPTDISSYLTQGSEYHLHEKTAPEGYLMSEDVYFTVNAIKGEFVIVTMTDEYQPTIKTTATFEDGRKYVAVEEGKDVTVYDDIQIKNLVEGKTYTVKGYIYDSEDVETSLAEYEETFTAESSEATLKATFTFAAEEGKDYVVFEYLFDAKGNMISNHCDIEDADQTVHAPKLTKVVVIKSDALDRTKHLSGCEITVFNADGTIAKDAYDQDAVKVTDKDGKVEFVLFYSESGYYVKETKAPKGYRINDDKFEVDLENAEIEIIVNDTALPAVADTGDIHYLPVIISGFVISGCLLAYVLIKKKKALS